MSFWLSLVFCGARTCGLREQAHLLTLEVGLPVYPCEWPGTVGFVKWVGEEAAMRWSRWHQKPPAKRVNYKKHPHVVNPFYPSLGQLLADGEGKIEDE
ncbi:Ribonucleases P/MRP protein subunit pop1, partial [Spiromyces aspiralis]